MAGISREKFKTLKGVFDLFTERNIFKIISQGYIEGIESPIALGKEANIFTAIRKDGARVILKIYRLSTCDFNKMHSYLSDDPRFTGVVKNQRKVIFAWAQKEYRNLLKAREAGVAVPTPLTCLFNIIVMGYIGNDSPAPMLKDARPALPKEFFDETVRNLLLLYNKAGLVHADLSPFNILNHHEKPVFIDFSQATTLGNVNARTYILRDIRNICSFFKSLGVDANETTVYNKLKV